MLLDTEDQGRPLQSGDILEKILSVGICQAPRTKGLCWEPPKVFQGKSKEAGVAQQSQREQDSSGYWSNSRAMTIESLVDFVTDSGFCSG